MPLDVGQLVTFSLPMSAAVDFAHNTRSKDGMPNAFAVFFKVGQNKAKGDWSAKYKFAYIEANSVPGGLTDGDFGRGNRQGHQWSFTYSLTKYLTAGVNVYYTEQLSGSEDDSKFLVQADLIWKF